MDDTSDVRETDSLLSSFCEFVLVFRAQFAYLFVFTVILIVLAVFSRLFIDQGTKSYVMLQLDFLILGALLVSVASILSVCKRFS
jgi:Ca2+/Na+ antiporter